jgi:hypothetical protein
MTEINPMGVQLDTAPGFSPSSPWNGGEGLGEEARMFQRNASCPNSQRIARPDGAEFSERWLDWPCAAAGTAALRGEGVQTSGLLSFAQLGDGARALALVITHIFCCGNLGKLMVDCINAQALTICANWFALRLATGRPEAIGAEAGGLQRAEPKTPCFQRFWSHSKKTDTTSEKMWVMTRAEARAPGPFQSHRSGRGRGHR